MTPLVIVPARQMSEGRPCKNRTAWPALRECVASLGWPVVVVTDDPAIVSDGLMRIWRPMGADHTVARVVAVAMQHYPYPVGVVLQPSSPTANRATYVQAAVAHLEAHPEATAVVSVVPWVGEPPSKACTLAEDGRLVIPASPEPRQAQPRAYRRDGTVYAVRAEYARVGDLYGPHPVPLLIDPRDSVTVD